VWLNNPLRPLEASGTSGMKLPPNGGINLSVLDGWWAESYNQRNGWAIGTDIPNDPNFPVSEEIQNKYDATSILTVIEQQVVPLYYAKPNGILPSAWIQLMRESMRTILPYFNTHRMVCEYNTSLYEPAAQGYRHMISDNFKNAKILSSWKQSMRKLWPNIKILEYHIQNQSEFLVGDLVTVQATVHLGEIKPDYVKVQGYFGPVEHGYITTANIIDLTEFYQSDNGTYSYTGTISATDSGAFGLNVRVIPCHPDMIQDHELRLITWAR
jgi:starch phosphorylase